MPVKLLAGLVLLLVIGCTAGEVGQATPVSSPAPPSAAPLTEQQAINLVVERFPGFVQPAVRKGASAQFDGDDHWMVTWKKGHWAVSGTTITPDEEARALERRGWLALVG